MLVTANPDMKNTHRVEIRNSDVAILSTAHNSAKNPDEWVVGIINLRTTILRDFRKHPRPWFATFSREAKRNIKTIT